MLFNFVLAFKLFPSERHWLVLCGRNARLAYQIFKAGSFLLAIVRVFLCPIFSPIFMYCSPVMQCVHFNVIFNIAIKAGGLACHKTRNNPSFFFLNVCFKSGESLLLYYSSFLCALHFNVVFLLWRISLTFDAFPPVLVFNPDLFFFSQSIYEFRTEEYYYCLYLRLNCEINKMKQLGMFEKVGKK